MCTPFWNAAARPEFGNARVGHDFQGYWEAPTMNPDHVALRVLSVHLTVIALRFHAFSNSVVVASHTYDSYTIILAMLTGFAKCSNSGVMIIFSLNIETKEEA